MKIVLGLLAITFLAGCNPERTVRPTEISPIPGVTPSNINSTNSCYSNQDSQKEEELYGCAFHVGDIGSLHVTLDTASTHGTIWPTYVDSAHKTMTLSTSYTNGGAHWGWYGVGDDCYSDTLDTNHPGEAHTGAGKERHCVIASPFMYRLWTGGSVRVSFPIDFAVYGYSTTQTDSNNTVYVEGGSGTAWDLVIHYDSIPSSAPTARMNTSVGKTESSPWLEMGSDTVHVPSNFVFRIGAWSSTDNWSDSSVVGRLLVRYLWHGDTSGPRTYYGAVKVHGDHRMARTHVFASDTGYHSVTGVVRNPTGASASRTVVVYAAGDLRALPTATPVSADPFVLFKDSVTHFGANATHDVRADSGYRWTVAGTARPWQTAATYDTTFASSGDRTVRLEVRNKSGVVADSSFVVHVNQCIWTSSGPAQILTGNSKMFVAGSGCTGRLVTITPTNGVVGFGSTAPCTSFSVYTAGVSSKFTVFGCTEGTVTVEIWDGATLIQTIELEVVDEY